MAFRFPSELTELIYEQVLQLVPSRLRLKFKNQGLSKMQSLSFFAPGLLELSEAFTSERSARRLNYLQKPPFRSAYLLYFLPINYAKAFYVLEKIPPIFWKQDHYRFLDLGAGPATASLAFLAKLAKENPKASVEIDLVDYNKGILEDGEALVKKYAEALALKGKISIKTFQQDLYAFKSREAYDLVFFHHVLNESRVRNSFELYESLRVFCQGLLKASGLLMIIEPALHRPTRNLMLLRDLWIKETAFKVLAPCLHQEACPMLEAHPRDWCHFYVDWEAPAFIKDLSVLIKRDNRRLKLAYLLLSQDPSYLPKVLPQDFLVVSNPIHQGRERQSLVCGFKGFYRLNALEGLSLPHLKRGDLIRLNLKRPLSKTFVKKARLSFKKGDKLEFLKGSS
ncbi:MAG: hypothetical protein KDK66_07410 [Deltaproteobacteria bacterium]|nr:hypothetical protein [Deltaproteobacteria bacterium]